MTGQANDLRKLWTGFQSARALITANNLEVFDHLKKPHSAELLAMALGADRRATTILLDALVSLGLLVKQAEKYRNTPMSNKFLVKGQPEYQGDIIRHCDTLWQNWSELDEVMMTGRPAGRAFDHYSFIMGMHNIAVMKVKDVMRTLRLKNVRKVLDLGCGPGTYGLEMARKGMAVTMFDLPETIKIAKKVASKQKVKGIRFMEGDFQHDNIGVGYDLILVSQIFHAYSAEDNMRLLQKCHRALNPKGRIVIHEFYIGRELANPPLSALFSINMLVNTEGGRCYSPREMTEWLDLTGYDKVNKKLLGDTVVLEASKVA